MKNELSCPNCGYINKENNTYCNKCGTKLSIPRIKCPYCHSDIILESNYCNHCGNKIIKNKYESIFVSLFILLNVINTYAYYRASLNILLEILSLISLVLGLIIYKKSRLIKCLFIIALTFLIISIFTAILIVIIL